MALNDLLLLSHCPLDVDVSRIAGRGRLLVRLLTGGATSISSLPSCLSVVMWPEQVPNLLDEFGGSLCHDRC